MGFSRRRIGKDGRPRYTAYYIDTRQQERSAGTFPTRKEADQAWRMVEASYAAGRPNDPRRGRMTFGDYMEQTWFPNHVLEPSTRQSYHYVLAKHLLPWFGPMRMGEIMPAQVREWVTERVASGISPATIRHAKIVLSAIFTTALNDLVIGLHPCKGVKSPTVAVKEHRILTPEEYERLAAALPTDEARLFVETLVESGLRWGEATELRRRDVHVPSRIVTVCRSVVEVFPAFHPTGGRFAVKPYPKSRRSRRVKVSPELVTALCAHADEHDLGPDDLLFGLDLFAPPAKRGLSMPQTSVKPSPTPLGTATGTGRSAATRQAGVDACTAEGRSPNTAHDAGATGSTIPARCGCGRAAGTCPRSGSATASGSRPA